MSIHLSSSRRSGRGKAAAPAGSAARARLIELLKDPRQGTRLLAGEALWRISADSRMVLPLILTSLQDHDWMIRDTAVVLAGQMGSAAAPAEREVRALLDDPSPYVRIDAAVALWKILNDLSDVLPPLEKIIRDQDNMEPYVRQLAIIAIGDIGLPARSAGKLLMDVSEDEYAIVRSAAAGALRKIQPRQ